MRKLFCFLTLIFVLICGTIFSFYEKPQMLYAESENAKIENVQVVSLGDSIVEGYTPESSAPLENNFSNLLDSKMNTNLQNYGISGDNTLDLHNNLTGIGEFDSSQIAYIKNSDVVILCIGANDILGPAFNYIGSLSGLPNENDLRADVDASLANFDNRYRNILDWFKVYNSSSQIYILNIYNPYTNTQDIGISGIFTFPLNDLTSEYVNLVNDKIEAIISSGDYDTLNLNYLDLYTEYDNAFKNGKDIVYASENPSFSTLDTDIDPHPTEEGHQIIADLIWRELENNLPTPVIESADVTEVLAFNYSKANIYSNVSEDAEFVWYINDQPQTALTESNLLDYSPQNAGEWTFKLKLNGIFSNEITLNFYGVEVLPQRTEPNPSASNSCDISFTYNFTEALTSSLKDHIKSLVQQHMFQIFVDNQSNYVVVNDGIQDLYSLEKINNDLIRYTPLITGNHKVSFIDGLVEIIMPYIEVAQIAYLQTSSGSNEFTLGEFEEIQLSFVFSSTGAQNKQWLWKLPNRSTMEYLPVVDGNLLNTYKVKPEIPGIYHFAVQYKFNNAPYTTAILKIRINPAHVEETFVPEITHTERQNSKNKIKAYEFKVTNISNIDPEDISWRINGIQQGTGYTFVLEPDFVDSYVVYAVINGQDSNHITVNASLDNTKEKIIIIASVVVGLSLLLALEIIIKIKKEKIW